MNEALRVPTDGFLTTAELAARSDFTLGLAAVSPSSRTIAGPGGTADVEPRVMQVIVALADAAGQVVTRETLFQRCWGGVFVGDDSLNRAVGAVRKLAVDIAAGSFEIETIPRTGYRLKGDMVGLQPATRPDLGGAGAGHAKLTRRAAIAGTATTAAVAAAAGLWFAVRNRSDPRFDALMARGDEAFRNGIAFGDARLRPSPRNGLAQLYAEAVRINPKSARAWGLLAYFTSVGADDTSAKESPALTARVGTAVRHAFDIDPQEPNARVAMYLLQGRMLDWIERDRQLRAILQTDGENLPAMSELMQLLQAAGLTRESWAWNERILSRSPLAQPFLVARSMKLWILGNVQESDNVIDRVRGLWPDYDFGFSIRFMLFALTGRTQAALAMLEGAPQRFPGPAAVALWRTVLGALQTRAAADVERARNACLLAAQHAPSLVNVIVMLLGALGQVDAAFEVTDGFILWRGKIVSSDPADGKTMDNYSRRMTQWLFTPPLARMRADARFAKLCDDFGLAAYWRERHVKPDYQVYG